MNSEKELENGELQQILESYKDLFGDLSDHNNLETQFYGLKFEDFLINNNNNNNRDQEISSSFDNDVNAQILQSNGQDDAVLLSQNLSEKLQSNDEFIEELKECIQRINEKKESL